MSASPPPIDGIRGNVIVRYELSSKKSGIQPKAVSVLANMDGITLYNSSYRLRHPLGIYNLSFGTVLKKMDSVLRELDKVRKASVYRDLKKQDWDETLVSNLDQMLDAIMEHLDDCKNIICCFFENSATKSANKAIREFNGEIKAYRNHVAIIVNAIKHNQNRLRSIFFETFNDFVPGYYAEGLLIDGTVGPNPEIHEKGNVAISLNRDLPFHICNLYFVSAVLANKVVQLTGIKPLSSVEQKTNYAELSAVLRKISVLPNIVFPDEAKKPYPYVKYTSDHVRGEERLLLEFPSNRLKPKPVPSGSHVQLSFGGDGVTSSFKIPYFGEGVTS